MKHAPRLPRSGGRQLSGGQWQKVALGRAFFRNAPIMMLDEPTAAIDAAAAAAAEAEVFEVLRKTGEGSTVLRVAHRFSAVRTADHIVVIDGGRVLEQGSHDELMASPGLPRPLPPNSSSRRPPDTGSARPTNSGEPLRNA